MVGFQCFCRSDTPGDPTLLIIANVIAGLGKVTIGLLPLALLRGGRVILLRKVLLIAAWVLGGVLYVAFRSGRIDSVASTAYVQRTLQAIPEIWDFLWGFRVHNGSGR